MPLKAAFFDVGDTLVEHWAPREEVSGRMRARIRAEMGEPAWLDALVAADLEPIVSGSLVQVLAGGTKGERLAPDSAKQDTHAWLRSWFSEHGHALDGIDLDRIRALMSVPLADVSTPVPGAFDAVKWCAEKGLRVVLVTNTLSRGDEEVLEDWQRFGLSDAIYGVVSSHSVGWRKPHPSIFERALEIADADAGEAFHIGDNLITDVYGAQQLGIRAIWRPKVSPVVKGRVSERMEGETECRHPSDFLVLDAQVVRCNSCNGQVSIEITPDAIVTDLTELRPVVEPWLEAAA